MRHKMLPLSLLLISTAATQPANAAGCINGQPSVEQEFRDAEYVVIGTISKIRKNVPVRLRYNRGFYNSRVMIQTLLVNRQFKGAPRRAITYRDEYSTAQFPMDVGSKYLLFYMKRKNGDLYIDVCGNSGKFMKPSSDLITQLEKLSKQS